MLPVLIRKEIGLPATVRVTPGSIEVMRVGAWGPGQLRTVNLCEDKFFKSFNKNEQKVMLRMIC